MTELEHDASAARAVALDFLSGVENTGRWLYGFGNLHAPRRQIRQSQRPLAPQPNKRQETNVTVGWTRSRWPWSSAGIEYESVRTASSPVSLCA